MNLMINILIVFIGAFLFGCQDERAVFQDNFVASCTYESQYGDHSEVACKCLSELYLQSLTNNELSFLNDKSGCSSPNDRDCMSAYRKKSFLDAEINKMARENPNDFAKGLQECITTKKGEK